MITRLIGAWFCKRHYNRKFRREEEERVPINIDEIEDRY